MLVIKPPFSLWVQLSSLSFFLAGNFADLLIIRICLSSAYVFAFINAIMGAPLWPLLRLPGKIQIDTMCWATLNLYVHISTVTRLIMDEIPVRLETHKEALWRMFYQTGGLSKRMFVKTIDPHCQVVTFHHGDDIPMGDNEWFYIIYQGMVQLTITDHEGAPISMRCAFSGQLFDFRALGILHDVQSLEKHILHMATAVSPTVILFRFPAKLMPQIANHPDTRLMWKELLMETLLRIVQRYFDRKWRQSGGDSANSGTSSNGDRAALDAAAANDDEPLHSYLHPLFAPLQKWEEPDPLRAGSGRALERPLLHILMSSYWSFTPPWPWKGFPPGLRQKLPAPSRLDKPVRKTASPAANSKERRRKQSKSVRDVESQSLLQGTSFTTIPMNSPTSDYSSLSSRASSAAGDDEAFLGYLHEIDEEAFAPPMAGVNVSFH